jgi:hypothetical protein
MSLYILSHLRSLSLQIDVQIFKNLHFAQFFALNVCKANHVNIGQDLFDLILILSFY